MKKMLSTAMSCKYQAFKSLRFGDVSVDGGVNLQNPTSCDIISFHPNIYKKLYWGRKFLTVEKSSTAQSEYVPRKNCSNKLKAKSNQESALKLEEPVQTNGTSDCLQQDLIEKQANENECEHEKSNVVKSKENIHNGTHIDKFHIPCQYKRSRLTNES